MEKTGEKEKTPLLALHISRGRGGRDAPKGGRAILGLKTTFAVRLRFLALGESIGPDRQLYLNAGERKRGKDRRTPTN